MSNTKKDLSNHEVKLDALGSTNNNASNLTGSVGISTGITPNDIDSTLLLNDKGGLKISADELDSAFKMLDIDSSGNISVSNLKKRLGVFFPDLSTKEYRFLMNNKKELSLEDLHEMIDDNDITNFDPIEEAFKLYDIENEGFISKSRLKDVFEAYGFDSMTKDDVEILGRAADVDGDGKITLSDFRRMMSSVDVILNSHAIQGN
jgi:calmodulin